MEEVANEQVDSELEAIHKEISKTFNISEAPGNGVVTMTRKFQNEEITITFDCQDEAEGSLDEEDFFKQHENDQDDAHDDEDTDLDDYDESEKYGINFQVTIKKGGSEMICECTAEQEISIVNVRVYSGDQTSEEKRAVAYDGPPFENLAEGLQDAFLNYLEDRKIDADLCHFILTFAQHKEQKEYVHWLKELSKFTES